MKEKNPNERDDGEPWRMYVARVAGAEGLADECLQIFDGEVGRGVSPREAACVAFNEWDLV